MQNRAVNAPITFEEIVMVMINCEIIRWYQRFVYGILCMQCKHRSDVAFSSRLYNLNFWQSIAKLNWNHRWPSSVFCFWGKVVRRMLVSRRNFQIIWQKKWEVLAIYKYWEDISCNEIWQSKDSFSRNILVKPGLFLA